ncbi:hypothetical protein Hypma_013983 [Hypsizygus marmoreus]|uniref:Uncharacterized protein n=1 Tax=Hypsizygus marmoreus TaxID=39966 RepID=A0A369KBV1_HYPMA|nr:hypothetical protein Hypma_013983 [Hypsizygus marmoreus]
MYCHRFHLNFNEVLAPAASGNVGSFHGYLRERRGVALAVNTSIVMRFRPMRRAATYAHYMGIYVSDGVSLVSSMQSSHSMRMRFWPPRRAVTYAHYKDVYVSDGLLLLPSTEVLASAASGKARSLPDIYVSDGVLLPPSLFQDLNLNEVSAPAASGNTRSLPGLFRERLHTRSSLFIIFDRQFAEVLAPAASGNTRLCLGVLRERVVALSCLTSSPLLFDVKQNEILAPAASGNTRLCPGMFRERAVALSYSMSGYFSTSNKTRSWPPRRAETHASCQECFVSALSLAIISCWAHTCFSTSTETGSRPPRRAATRTPWPAVLRERTVALGYLLSGPLHAPLHHRPCHPTTLFLPISGHLSSSIDLLSIPCTSFRPIVAITLDHSRPGEFL